MVPGIRRKIKKAIAEDGIVLFVGTGISTWSGIPGWGCQICILCTDKDETIVKYSALNDSKQIFASKYMTVLPTEEELAYELERNQSMLMDNVSQTKE